MLYTGMTNNIEERLQRHNQGYELATKYRRPFELIFYAAFRTRLEAAEFEKYLKTGSGKRFIQTKVHGAGSNLPTAV
jgi:putative endonuclease